MKKVMLLLVITSFTTLLLAGCEPRITEGEIIEKNHMEESMTTSYIPVIISNGSTTTTTMVPMFITNPESWQIIIRAYDDEVGKYVQEDFYVEKNVFDSVEVGDYFKFDPNMGTDERPEIREEANEKDIEKFQLNETSN